MRFPFHPSILRHTSFFVLLWTFVLVAACESEEPGEQEVLPGEIGCAAPEDTTAGEATFYDADGSGACGFPARGASGTLRVAAIGAPSYEGARACGGCAEATGPLGTVKVRITDRCPECAAGDLDLSPDAFAEIANPVDGRVAITWRYVACENNDTLRVHLKEGSSAFWIALQVRGHRYRIQKLEARPAGEASYRQLGRASYNYFVDENGLGPEPFSLRITDVHGSVIEESAVSVGDNVERPLMGRFPPCTEAM